MLIGKCDPEELKDALRAKYKRDAILAPARCYAEARDRAWAFWPTYEQVNRDYCPDDPVYSTVREGAAISTTANHLHFKSPSSGQCRILEIIIGGEATSTAVNRLAFAQYNATLAGASAITPEKFNSRSPAAAGTYGHSNTSALLAANAQAWAINAFGGLIDWKAAPGEEFYFVNGEVCGIRSLSGTSTFTSTVVFEEM
jgi:hypothetical protein